MSSTDHILLWTGWRNLRLLKTSGTLRDNFFLIHYDGLNHCDERALSRSEVMASVPVILKLRTRGGERTTNSISLFWFILFYL